MKRWQLIVSAACVSFALTACGGGDSSSNSGNGATAPASPTKTLTNSADEARVLAQRSVEGSSDNVAASRKQTQLDGFSRLAGASTSASSNGVSSQALKTLAVISERFVGKQTTQLSCADLQADNPNQPADEQIRDCSGSVTFETNLSDSSVDNTGAIAAGTFVNMIYNNLRFTTTSDGLLSVNGTIRLEYIERFVSSPPSGKLRYQAVNLSSSADGESFGPESFEYIIEFNGNRIDVIADGVRLTDFNTSYTDDSNYTINAGSVIDQIGDDYVQIDYSNWQVVDGIPQTGSRLTITGTNGTATVDVLSNNGTAIAMRITINADGSTTDYDLQINITNGSVTII